MKAALPFIALFFLFIGMANGQPLGLSPTKVVPAARKHFAEAHPGQKVLWQYGEKGRYEAFYIQEGVRHTDVYAADGTLIIQKTAILQGQTPEPVAKVVRENYPSAEWIQVSEMVTAAGKRLVEVNLLHGGKEYRLNYDLQGKLHSGGQREAKTQLAEGY